ncbi:hypothetical protein Cgig2_020173 [Carnegiea gigantea]|uniref:Uncharacterized protein n=1 Tax=Carnegiea gigantea TaxID=171969 RepID=A0A9Q1KTA6_9CARY|nr:hypothetical protein Cgig2_020173 [Carnegiea gigantea]
MRKKKRVTHQALNYPHDPPPQKPRPQYPGGHGFHLGAADARPRSGGKPRNSCPPETLGPASPKLCVNTIGYQCGPAGSLASWPGPPFPPPRSRPPRPLQAPSLVGVASSSCRLHGHPDQPSAFPNATALTPPGKCLGHGYLLVGNLWGIRSTGGEVLDE